MNSPQTKHLIVLPWLGAEEPVTVGEFEILPVSIAVERYAVYASALRAATSYFFAGNRINDVHDWEGETRLVPVEPCVIVLDDEGQSAPAYDATLCLFFAVLFDNSTYRYANGSNFRQFQQTLRPEFEGFSRRGRRMFGSQWLATQPRNAIETRPFWCGKWHKPNSVVLELAQKAFASAEAEPIRQCLSHLIVATSDSDEYETNLERSLYAVAVEHLLHRTDQTQSDRVAKQRALRRELLGDTLRQVRRLTHTPDFAAREFCFGNLATSRILRYAQNERNNYLHANKQGRDPLSQQLAVAPNLAVFRALSALLLACMAKAAGVALSCRLLHYIAAVEDWCDELPTMFKSDPEVVLNRFREIWALYSLRLNEASKSLEGGTSAPDATTEA